MHLNLHQFGPRYVPSKIRPTVHSRGRPMSQQGQNSSMAVRFHLFFPTLSQSSFFFFSTKQRTTHFFEALSLFLRGQKRVASCSLCQLYFTMQLKLLDHQSTFHLLHLDAATDRSLSGNSQNDPKIPPVTMARAKITSFNINIKGNVLHYFFITD